MTVAVNPITAVINGISARELKLVRKTFVPLTEAHEVLSSTGIDSLEYMVLYMWLGELYGVDNKTFEKIEAKGDVTLNDMIEFLEHNATKQPSAEEALAIYDES